MTLAIVTTRAGLGLEAPEVHVEAHLANGLPGMTLVGLPEAAVKESRERVRSALTTSGFEFPLRRITLNLAPADLPKEGGRFDLPIALGLLIASGQLPPESLADIECAGELALDGHLRPVTGMLPFALATRRAGRKVIVPEANAAEAALAGGLEVFPARHLMDVVAHLAGQTLIAPYQPQEPAPPSIEIADLADVRGQHQARHALEVAAAGGHNLLFAGPPGTGKTLLASRLPGILPPLEEDEILEVAAIRSVSGMAIEQDWGQRPFRAPHHTASAVALVGGGSRPRPGEISLAHHGVLFLDELPEFNRHVLEVMREPMESGEIHISRANHERCYPARFQLVAAMNPCPCGHLGDPRQSCVCTANQIQRYQSRVSGPLLDRIDLQVEVPALQAKQLTSTESGESSQAVRDRVMAARQRQSQRGVINARLSGRRLDEVCALNAPDRAWLADTLDRLKLSARAYHRILRVALTLADLVGLERPGREQL
ncbi:YifB family Mg chelatase-like AAA ATPase, partial [Halomonas huangheensis]